MAMNPAQRVHWAGEDQVRCYLINHSPDDIAIQLKEVHTERWEGREAEGTQFVNTVAVWLNELKTSGHEEELDRYV